MLPARTPPNCPGDGRELRMLGLVLRVGKYCERASRTIARAARKLSAAAAISWLEELAFSSSSFNCGSLYTFHQFPRFAPSLGWVVRQTSDPFAAACGISL